MLTRIKLNKKCCLNRVSQCQTVFESNLLEASKMKPTQIDKTKQVSLAAFKAGEVDKLPLRGDPLDNDNDDEKEKEKEEEEVRLAELYQAAKDENELLEFKNYELLFKIQELEQNQRNILNKLVINENGKSNTGQPEELAGLKQVVRQSKQRNSKVGLRQPIRLMREDEVGDRYLEVSVSSLLVYVFFNFL